MFRLVDDEFIQYDELHKAVVFCLTETIKSHLIEYFEKGYENQNEQNLYLKTKTDKALGLFTKKFLDEMSSLGVNPQVFIPKKMAQFLTLLNDKEEKTPDLFIEYILFKIIDKQCEKKYDYMVSEVIEKKEELKKMLRAYAKEELDFKDIKERNQYVKDTVKVVTEFTCLLGAEEADDSSLAFWDWDFSFFDDYGFERTFAMFLSPVGSMRGYGIGYIKDIFTSVGEDVPDILKV